MSQSKYFRYTSPKRNQYTQDDAGTRGLAAGVAAGKLVSGLAGGFEEMQKNAVANRLMNTEDAPRAALVDPGSQTVATPESTQITGGTPGWEDPDPDPIPAPPPPMGVNPDYKPPDDQYDLSNDVAAVPGTPQTVPATVSRVPNTIPAGVPTAGTPQHTGGVNEMELQKQMLAMRLQKSQDTRASAKEAADAADRQAEAAGTGKYALEAATKRAQLAHTQAETESLLNPKVKEDKNAQATNITGEPVRDQKQLDDYVDKQYGSGVLNKLISVVSDQKNLDDPKIVTANSVIIPLSAPNPLTGESAKSLSMPLEDAKAFIKQQNVMRLAHGLPAFRVPGEDQTLGTTPRNPYQAKTNLDVYSRAGGWIRLPDGRLRPPPGWKG